MSAKNAPQRNNLHDGISTLDEQIYAYLHESGLRDTADCFRAERTYRKSPYVDSNGKEVDDAKISLLSWRHKTFDSLRKHALDMHHTGNVLATLCGASLGLSKKTTKVKRMATKLARCRNRLSRAGARIISSLEETHDSAYLFGVDALRRIIEKEFLIAPSERRSQINEREGERRSVKRYVSARGSAARKIQG